MTGDNYHMKILPIYQKAIVDKFFEIMRPKFEREGIEIPKYVTPIIMGQMLELYMEVTGEESADSDNPFIMNLPKEHIRDDWVDIWIIEKDNVSVGFMVFTYDIPVKLAQIRGDKKNVFSLAYLRPEYRRKGIMFNCAKRVIPKYDITHLYSEIPNPAGRKLILKLANELNITCSAIRFITDDTGQFKNIKKYPI